MAGMWLRLSEPHRALPVFVTAVVLFEAAELTNLTLKGAPARVYWVTIAVNAALMVWGIKGNRVCVGLLMVAAAGLLASRLEHWEIRGLPVVALCAISLIGQGAYFKHLVSSRSARRRKDPRLPTDGASSIADGGLFWSAPRRAVSLVFLAAVIVFQVADFTNLTLAGRPWPVYGASIVINAGLLIGGIRGSRACVVVLMASAASVLVFDVVDWEVRVAPVVALCAISLVGQATYLLHLVRAKRRRLHPTHADA